MKRAKFVHVRYYKNRTKKGKATASPVKRGIFYYSYGTKEMNPNLQSRGHWFSVFGEERYVDVAGWAARKALQHKYTYTMVLSLRDGPMQPGDFTDAMQQAGLFEDWRLIPHYDTAHDHAHVVAFRDKTLSRKEFDTWRNQVAASLLEAEEQRLQEAEQMRQTAQAAEPSLDQPLDDEWDWEGWDA